MQDEKKRPRRSGVLSSVIITGFIILVAVGIFVPMVSRSLTLSRGTLAIQSLRSLHSAQMRFQSEHGHFATLRELVEDESIDPAYAGGEAISGYIYSDSAVTATTYCIHATRQNDGTDRKDFSVDESGIVRYIRSPNKGTVPKGAGTPVNQLAEESPAPSPAAPLTRSPKRP